MKHKPRRRSRSVRRPAHRFSERIRRRAWAPESLENRLLLAADLDLTPDAWQQPVTTDTGSQEPIGQAPLPAAEGENVPADDLIAFAQALDAAGVKFYGAAWCPACRAQKELFEDGADFLPFFEVTNPDRTLNQLGQDENIGAFPTWVFPDDTREEGVLSLAELSSRSGVAIPTSKDPTIKPIDDVTLFGGSPLHVGLDGYDPNGGPLTYTVQSSNPSLVEPTIITGNRSARITVGTFGEMVFQLFEQRAERPTSRFIELAEAGFYDAANNDPPILFHRVIDNFVAQFGDPTGTGGGGSSLGDFDDQFHPELQHNRAGVLSFAKSSDDTNDSQLFVTDVPTRFLDGNHSVTGQLVEGDANRDALTATATNAQDRPTFDAVIESVEIFNDIENGLLMLKAAEGASGTADITVTVTDEDGNSHQEIFTVTVSPDSFNTGPWLEDVAPVETDVDTPVTFQLQAVDVEGDAVRYSGVNNSGVNYDFNVNQTTGEVTVTPPTGFVGTLDLTVRVRPATTSNTSDTFDTQLVPIQVNAAPGSVDLDAGSDSGTSATDNITNKQSLDFTISDVVDGATVRLYHDSTVLGQAVVQNGTASITTTGLNSLGDGTFTVFATQTINSVESSPFGSLDVTLDTTDPVDLTSTPPTAAEVNQTLEYDAEHPEEGTAGFTYSLLNAPSGVTLNATTGVVTWTPAAGQIGPHSFAVSATDAAGNANTQPIEIVVDPGSTDDRVAFRLATTDDQGIPVSVVDINDEFLFQVFVEDLGNLGVFSAYLDVNYDSNLVEVTGPLVYGSSFPNVKSGDTGTAGLIDEAGATSGSLAPSGGDEFLLFSVPMKAIASGQVNFTSDGPDNLPFNEILVFGNSDAVDLDKVTFGSTSLTIDLAFQVSDDLFNVDEDSQSVALDVLDNDTFLPGLSGTLTVNGVGTGSAGGTIEINNDSSGLLYTPAADFFGEETFTYTATDGNGEATATVTVQVAGLNDPPTANDDTFTVVEDTNNTLLDVLANDTSAPDGAEALRVTAVGTTSEGGTVTIGPNGTHVRYTPPSNFFGEESFSYTISDGNGENATATVTVTVTEFNDPPVARNDSVTVAEDSVETQIDVLDNDDTAGDTGETLSITQVFTPSQGGTVTIQGTSVLYTPAADFFGTETFQYEISDGNGGTATGIVNVQVTPTNDPPTAANDSLTAIRDQADQVLDVLANDSIAPDTGETLTIVSVGTSSAGATLTISQDGRQVLYTPPSGFTGADSFTYTIDDGTGEEDQATVNVEVLDFIPVDVAGTIFVDVNDNGLLDPVELPLGNVRVLLTGADFRDQAVSLEAVTNAQGKYVFDGIAPGTYQVAQAGQPRHLLDGRESPGPNGATIVDNDMFEIEVLDGVDALDYNFAERGRAPGVVNPMMDFLASTPLSGILADTEAAGTTSWYATRGDWSQAASLGVAVNGDSAAVQLVNGNAESLEASVAINRPDQFFAYQTSAESSLVRVPGALNDLAFAPVGGGSSSASGEGEASADSASAVANAAPSNAAPSNAVLPAAEGEAGSLSLPGESSTFVNADGTAESRLRTIAPPVEDGVDAWMSRIGATEGEGDTLWDDGSYDVHGVDDYESAVDTIMELGI